MNLANLFFQQVQRWLVTSACLLAIARAVAVTGSPLRCSVATRAEFMACLNATSGLTESQMLFLQGDVRLQTQDLEPYRPWMPIRAGEAVIIVTGDPEKWPVLDFGGAVGVSYHPVGTTWLMQNMHIQGLASHSDGYAAGDDYRYEMVNGLMWPSTTGEANHLMAFRNVTITPPVGTPCDRSATAFKVESMRRGIGRNDTITLNDDGSFHVGQFYSGSYPMRDVQQGQWVGNVRFTFDNVTIKCAPPSPLSAPATVPMPLSTAMGMGIASTPKELAFYLSTDSVYDIVVAGHLQLTPATMGDVPLPIVIARGRNVTLRSHDENTKVLDFGQIPYFLMLEQTSSMAFQTMELRGVAFPSDVYQDRNVQIDGSPVWPTLDGIPGHRLEFTDCKLHVVDTPCSRNSIQLDIDLLRRAVGDDAVERAGDTTLKILKPVNRTVFYREMSTGRQLYHTEYLFDRTLVSCLEDPGLALANEIMEGWTPPGGGSDSEGSHSGSQGAIIGAVLGGVLGAALLAAAAGGFVALRRRRRRRQQIAQQAQHVEDAPDTPVFGGKLSSMESGGLKGEGYGSMGAISLQDSSDPFSVKNSSAAAKNTLWRSKFGAIDGLEIHELLGRGAYGRVYKGRWNGALVAVKVVEHRVVAGKAYDLSREPLLSLSVSHPNCITTFKLSVVRVLTEQDSSAPSSTTSGGADAYTHSGPSSGSSSLRTSQDTDTPAKPLPPSQKPDHPFDVDTGSSGQSAAARLAEGGGGAAAATAAGGSQSGGGTSQGSGGGSDRRLGSGGRRLQSLLSGAQAVEVVSTSEALLPGLYETWIIGEYCDQRTLGEAVAEGKFRVPGTSTPDMMAVYLSLLDVALGMEYLHNDLNLLHGDLKPTNVLLKGARNDRRGFTCKLADFGLSRLLGTQDTHVDTSSVGTPSHAAPEVLSQGRLTKQGDIFAFGVIAWELVAGEEPYPGMLAVQIILQVVQQGYRPPIPATCPPALKDLVERCWHQDPSRRPPYSQVVQELKSQIMDWRKHQCSPPRAPHQSQRKSGDSAMEH